MKRWYVVQTPPRAEAKALWHLENQHFSRFLPRIRPPLFAKLDPEATRWRSINGSRCVSGFVNIGNRPSPVPHCAMQELMSAVDDMGPVPLTALGMLTKGAMVKILSAAFAGQTGEIERLISFGRGRVQVQMTSRRAGLSARPRIRDQAGLNALKIRGPITLRGVGVCHRAAVAVEPSCLSPQ